MNGKRDSKSGERGQLLPIIALGIFAILGMVSLSVDVGYWRYQQRLEQSAADAAAVAGAIQLNYPTSGHSASVTSVARATAGGAPYGYMHDGKTVIVSVSTTPSPSPRTGATPYPANSAVEVNIQKQQPSFFAGVFGLSNTPVTARAVAVAVTDKSACLYQLATGTDNGFLTSTGNNSINLRGCGLLANGAIADNPGGFSSDTTSVGYYDTLSLKPAAPTTTAKLGSPVGDPCFKISSCNYLQTATASLPAAPPASNTIDASTALGNLVINPNLTSPVGTGTYANPVYVNNCCNSATTFQPGIYYVYQGTATQMGPLYGSGVTIVNVNGSLNEGGLGTGASTLSGPTFGPTAGVTYFQPANNGNSQYNGSVIYNTTCTLNGGGNHTSIFSGLFYAPSADCTFNGGSVTFAYGVFGSLRDNGGGNGDSITIDPSLNPILSLNNDVATHVVIDQ